MGSKNVHTVVLPNGDTETRKSARHIVYSHALVGWAPRLNSWRVLSYSRGAAPLQKQLSQWPGYEQKAVVDVRVELAS